jgi:hypothetical protein
MSASTYKIASIDNKTVSIPNATKIDEPQNNGLGGYIAITSTEPKTHVYDIFIGVGPGKWEYKNEKFPPRLPIATPLTLNASGGYGQFQLPAGITAGSKGTLTIANTSVLNQAYEINSYVQYKGNSDGSVSLTITSSAPNSNSYGWGFYLFIGLFLGAAVIALGFASAALDKSRKRALLDRS